MHVQKAKHGYKLEKSLYGKYEEIPEEWEIAKIEDLFDVGSSKRVLESQWQSEGVPFYRGREITSLSKYGKVENDLFISKELYQEYASKYGIPKAGDILITGIGTVGNSYLVKEDEEFYFKDASVLWLSKNSNVNSKFVSYWFKSEKFFQQLDKGNGSTVDSLTIKKLQSIKVTLPLMLEQQKIASILLNVDSLINQTQKEIEQTQKIKKGLIQKLLTKGIGHTKFKKKKWFFDEQLEIPESWNIIDVNEITISHKQGLYTTQTYSDNGIKIVRVNDLHNPSLSYRTMEHLDLDNKTFESFKISKGDFLIARTGNIGNYGIVTEDIPCVFVSDIIRFVFNSKILLNDFFGIFFESNLLSKQLKMIQQSSSHIHINAETIKSLKITLPSLIEQQKIASILSNVDSQIQKQQEYKSKLESLKKGLMQKLLTGQIRVKV